jgi:glutathione S-transferase
MKSAVGHLDYIDFLLDHRKWIAGSTISLADLAAAAQISVADYLGGIDWAGHALTKAWYSAFKSRRSFRPLLAERISGIEPPSYYENPDF